MENNLEKPFKTFVFGTGKVAQVVELLLGKCTKPWVQTTDIRKKKNESKNIYH
jgi:hypothetical protein